MSCRFGVHKAIEIAHFGDQHHRIDQRNAAHRLQSLDNRAQISFAYEVIFILAPQRASSAAPHP